MTNDELETLRDGLIAHALARRVLAVQSTREGVRTITVGRVVGVARHHVCLLPGERARDVVVPLEVISAVTLVEGDSKAVGR